MASNALVYSDHSCISRADLQLHRVETLLVVISGLAVAGLVLLAVVSVTGRMFFNQPLSGYIDWIEQFMPVIAFAGISYALRNGTHVRMDMLIARLGNRTRAYYLVELVATVLVFILFCLLVWGAFSHFGRSFDWAQPMFSRDSSIDIGLPLWPAKLLVPLAFVVMVLRAFLQIIAYAKAIVTSAGTPVAIPLTQSVHEQAQAQAAQLIQHN